MKPSEPQPPMPSLKFWLHVFLFIIALSLLITLWRQSLIVGERRVGILVGVMTTLFIISMVELLPEILRWITERRRQGKFKRFFGAVAFKDDVRLVHAYRTLIKSSDPYPFVAYCQRFHQDFRPEGTDAWLAFQDVRAAAYLAAEVHAMTGRNKVAFIHDSNIDTDDFEFCAISIGLGFNEFTHYLAGLCSNKLFKIEWGESPKNKLKTDLFKINGSVPEPLDGEDYALIARIVSKSVSEKPRVSFVCAGRTAAGTAAAGFFLAKNWPKLLKLYEDEGKKTDLDSMAVVIQHTADDSGIGIQKFDFTGKIVEKYIAWEKASGLD